ncbi:MAG: ribonuclease HII [bacterium]|nr:ribonuclease HII [bacterium]
MVAPSHPLARHDHEFTGGGRQRLAGVDEAGRGCWAGPVVAAAVVLPDGWCPAGLDDSKRLTARRRDVLYDEIRASACQIGACAVSASEIDSVNILQATLRAMARAVARLTPPPDRLLIDGLHVPETRLPADTLVGGDGLSAAVAAASVVAKVLRDRIMVAWDRHYPDYGFASHKGYGAAAHRSALDRCGPCPLHRLTFRPLSERDQGRLF